MGSTIRVTCHRGFRLLGSKSRLCVVNDDGTDGHWTGTDPTCQGTLRSSSVDSNFVVHDSFVLQPLSVLG